MNISTNETKKAGGAFADGLTLIRALLVPVIMFVIIGMGWPGNLQASLLACILFAIAAATDIFDDMSGGTEDAPHRTLGWFDDIADQLLIWGTLLSMTFVIAKAGVLGWAFAIPAGIILLRDALVAALKGNSLRKQGWPETRFSNLKTALTFVAVAILLASPWLTSILQNMEGSGDPVKVWGSNAPMIWFIGQTLLWLAALFSIYTGIKILTGKAGAANDG